MSRRWMRPGAGRQSRGFERHSGLEEYAPVGAAGPAQLIAVRSSRPRLDGRLPTV
ncbi:MAG: hypothetical protein GX937_12480 [Lentisphaerae bacterium]|nr:hypothetical protein [Lentisphaerota bacterium]